MSNFSEDGAVQECDELDAVYKRLSRDYLWDEKECMRLESPAVNEWIDICGNKDAIAKASKQVYDLALWIASDKEADDRIVEELTYKILSEAKYLTLSELLYFFHLAKIGKVGHFYGALRPKDVMDAFNEFMELRMQIFAKHRRAQEDAENEYESAVHKKAVAAGEDLRQSLGISNCEMLHLCAAGCAEKADMAEAVRQARTYGLTIVEYCNFVGVGIEDAEEMTMLKPLFNIGYGATPVGEWRVFPIFFPE